MKYYSSQGTEEYVTCKSKRKVNWIGHILRIICLLQRVIEGKIKGEIEVIGRRGRRRRKLLDDLKEMTGKVHSFTGANPLSHRKQCTVDVF
jgi:hypothetical protein